MYKRPLRILYVGEFVVKTGYGTVGENLCDRLYEIGRDYGMPKYEIFVQALGWRKHPYDESGPGKPYKV